MPIRWDPFDEALDLGCGLMGERRLGLAEPGSGAWSPPVDIFETVDALYIKTEVPGVSPEEIRVDVHGQRLTIAGERGRSEASRRYHHLERITGAFERSFNLSADLAVDDIKASYCEGVLEIRLPKQVGKASRQIEIKSP